MKELYRFFIEKLGDNEEYCQAFSFQELAELIGQLEIDVPVDEITAANHKEIRSFFDEMIRQINESSEEVVANVNDYISTDGDLIGIGFSVNRF